MPRQTYAHRPWIPAARSFADQPEVLTRLPEHLAGQLESLSTAARRVAVVGIGASHAAAAAGVHRMRRHGLDATRHLPVEMPDAGVPDLVVAASQSGRSAEVVDVASTLIPARLISLTNYRPSPLGDLAGFDLNLGDHDDSSVSFLSFTGTLLAFGMLADHWAGRLDVPRWQRLVASAIASAEAAQGALDAAAEVLGSAPAVDVVAPGSVIGAAEEAALMFREGPRVPATGMETRTYLHGPMDVAGSAAHVVIGGAREARLIEQLAERTDRLVFISVARDLPLPAEAAVGARVEVPDDDPLAQTIGVTIMMQYLAMRVATARGVLIDEPVFERLDTKTSSVGA